MFATTVPLEERHRETNANTHLVPNVGDFDHFHPGVDRETTRVDLRDLARPVYGFVGNLVPDKVDLDLLEELARRIDVGTLLLAGPSQGLTTERLAELTRHACVRLLGPVPYPEMPSVVAAFDVGLIPYVESEYTRSCFPLKLYEYLAAGKPVVASGLPELRGMEPDVVVVAGVDEFAGAVARALELGSQADVDRRVTLAAGNTWDVRTERVLELVAAEL